MEARARYDDDVHAWAEEQAAALRRLAMSRRDLPNDLDLQNIAEEIEDVGNSQRAASKSYIRQIFVHLIKLYCNPDSESVRHWRGEIVTFHNNLSDRLDPSMYQRIDLNDLWAQAWKEVEAKIGDEATLTALTTCKLRGAPVSLENLASENFDSAAALASIENG